MRSGFVGLSAEWSELRELIGRMTARLQVAFEPDHFNYAFLQNEDRHVHLHVIPRYARSREAAGLRFEDPEYPGFYAVHGSQRRVRPAVLDALARLLTG